MKRYLSFLIKLSLLILLLSGCAAFRSGIRGEFGTSEKKNLRADKVSVLFIISHYGQVKGYDAIPKLEKQRQIITDFDDFFIDALNELTNVKSYATYTEYASDVSDPHRRAEKDSLISAHDFILRMKFSKESSFAGNFLGTLVSTASATLLPVPYSRQYSLNVDVYNSEDVLIGNYKRGASLTNWVQTLLIFIYPFHSERLKEEQIYIQSMHDVFRQIESEGILRESRIDDE